MVKLTVTGPARYRGYPVRVAMTLIMIFITFIGTARGAGSSVGAIDYRVGPKDVIQVTVLAGGESQVFTKLVVTGSGELNVPFIGTLQARGLTQDELERSIQADLARDYFVNPQVQVQIIAYHSLQYFISGAVKQSGLYELNFHPTLMDLIAKAGGVSPDRGNLAYILRGGDARGEEDLTTATSDADAFESKLTGRESIRINLIKLLDQGDMRDNITLESGDTVYIPLSKSQNQAFSKVYVDGEVKSPGVYEFYPGLTAFAACIMASGFSTYAAPNRARVIRSSESGEQQIFKINLEKVQRGDTPDFPLQPGDRIFIPESWL